MIANMFQHYRNFGIADYRQSSFNDALNNFVVLIRWQILMATNSVNVAQILTNTVFLGTWINSYFN